MIRRASLIALGAAVGLGTLTPALAQSDPDLKVEFKVNEQRLRETLDLDHEGLHGTGDIRLGSDKVSFYWLRNADTDLVRENGKLIGAESGFELTTRFTKRVQGDDGSLSTEELRQAIEQSGDVFAGADLSGKVRATKHGVGAQAGAGVNIPLGQTEGTIAQGTIPLTLDLKIVKIKLVSGGAVTKGGVSADAEAAFDVTWQGNFKVKAGVGGGVNILRGLRGNVQIEVEVDKAEFRAAMHRAVEATKRILRDAKELAKKAGKAAKHAAEQTAKAAKAAGKRTKDVVTNYRGPARDSSVQTAEPQSGAPVDLSGKTPAELAARFAPVIYQKLEGDSNNTLLRVDYDGDWNTANNLNNSRKAGVDRTPTVYYDVKETPSHYYVTYSFYFARTELNQKLGFVNFAKLLRQENDMEGAVVMVRKGAKAGEEIEMVVTTQLNGTQMTRYASKAAQDWEAKELDSDGQTAIRNSEVRFIDEVGNPQYDAERTHPQLWVSPRMHNVWAYNGRDDVDAFDKGVVYNPALPAQAPTLPKGTTGYALRPLSELSQATSKDGKLAGDEGLLHKARLPQAWTTSLPGIAKGGLFNDPEGTIGSLYEIPSAGAGMAGTISGQ